MFPVYNTYLYSSGQGQAVELPYYAVHKPPPFAARQGIVLKVPGVRNADRPREGALPVLPFLAEELDQQIGPQREPDGKKRRGGIPDCPGIRVQGTIRRYEEGSEWEASEQGFGGSQQRTALGSAQGFRRAARLP